MRRCFLAGVIVFVLLFDCVLVLPRAFKNQDVSRGEMTELHCSGRYILLLWECQCQISEIEQIILSRIINGSADLEYLAGLNKTSEVGTNSLIPITWNQHGWVFYFEEYEITAQYFESDAEINGIYVCTVAIRQGSNVSNMNATAVVHVNVMLSSPVPVAILEYATQILAFLIFLTVFSCVFIIICVCTKDRTTVPEKRQKFNKWKEMNKQKLLDKKRSSTKSSNSNPQRKKKNENPSKVIRKKDIP